MENFLERIERVGESLMNGMCHFYTEVLPKYIGEWVQWGQMNPVLTGVIVLFIVLVITIWYRR